MNRSNQWVPLLILGILFFVFGFITWVNGTLIPYLKIACELNYFQSLWVTFAFYIAYFIMAIPSSMVLQKTGLKKGMMYGLMLMALGCLAFIPAAFNRNFYLFLLGLFVIGTGLALLQTASNPYITTVGPIDSAAKRISIMGICNKLAGVLAPFILGAIILKDANILEESIQQASLLEKTKILQSLSERVVVPYIILSLALCALSVWIYYAPLPETTLSEEQKQVRVDFKGITQFPHLILGVLAIFLYVGAEVIAADTIGGFGQYIGVPLDEAKNFPSYTLLAMVFGYILGIFLIPKYLSQAKALAYSAIISLVCSIGILLFQGYAAVFCLALLGLGNALMWPAIWPLALKNLGKYTALGSALLIMAIAGGAVLPLIYGFLADVHEVGPQKAYFILIPCYLYILYYSLKGYQQKDV